MDFKAWQKAAWEEVDQFYETAEDYSGENNPQHRLAPEFFQFYLEKRPSEIATKALSNAFTMWGNLKGVSDQVQAALKHISYAEDVWDEVEHGLLRSFGEHDGRQKEAILLLEELVEKVVPSKSRSALLYTLANNWKYEGKTGKARRGFEQIIAWDASEWHVGLARGHLYEFDNLNLGQLAPRFSLPDIDGNHIDLADYQGKVVVLHFWGTTCGWCELIYPINGIPAEYIIDQDGKIAFKLLGWREGSGEELEEAVRSLVI